MTTILALDVAWTATEPTGVALVQSGPGGWRCVALAPSYHDFYAQADGGMADWSATVISGTRPDVPRLLNAGRSLAGERIDLVTIDMPVATVPFSSRRVADDAISAEFGARWCSAHTPNAKRPGQLGADLSAAIRACGYELATTAPGVVAGGRLIEVYPHPALLSLLHRDRRVPYKVAKSRRYWPELTVRERIAALLAEFHAIHRAIAQEFGSLGLELPSPNDVRSLSSLKRYEDALDALVCAWVGVQYLGERAVALGDDTATIWCPCDVVYGHGVGAPRSPADNGMQRTALRSATRLNPNVNLPNQCVAKPTGRT